VNYAEVHDKLAEHRRQIAAIREQMRQVQGTVEPQEVHDYELANLEGPVRLSALFGTHEDLILVHNMGTGCAHCTLWADGYNGIHPHVLKRAAFAVASPDTPEVQKRFAADRGWRFPMVSHAGTSFAADMGYASTRGWLPGVSVFRRDGARILRVSDTGFSPGDDFCTLWHFFDLLPQPENAPPAASAKPAASTAR
jgi:predicted dithiol-disulfide oxidoreductase (DUF899 family)